MSMLQKSNKVYVLALLLAVLTVLIYQPVIYNDFLNYDDDVYVTSNSMVQKGLSLESVKWAFTSGHASNWHPLTWLSHMTDYELYKLVSSGHHLTNILLHAANSALLLLLLWALTGSVWRSAFIAALFAVHPLHVESVAWVAERKDLLSTLFWILTTLSYVRYVKSGRKSGYAMVIVLYALGLMSKPMLVSLPFALLLLDFWPLKRFAGAKGGGWRVFRRLALEKMPLFALALASCIITFYVQRHGGAVKSLSWLPLSVRLDNAAVSYLRYLVKMAWPQNMAVFYPHPADGIPAWQIAGSVAALVGITAVSIIQRIRRPYLLAGWGWYLVTLLPVIGIVQVGEQCMADRYTYIPLIGIFILITWFACDILKNRKASLKQNLPVTIACAAASLVILSSLALITGKQLVYWKDNTSIYQHAIDVTDDNWIICNNLGVVQKNEGRLNEAVQSFQQAIAANPNVPHIYNNLANTYKDLGRIDDAIAAYKTCLKLKPSMADVASRLAITYSKQGDLKNAVTYFKQSIKYGPKNAAPHYNLGVVYMNMGRLADAESEFREAVRLNPKYTKAYGKLATLLYAEGKYAGAWTALHKFEELGGADNPEFRKRLSAKMPKPAASP